MSNETCYKQLEELNKEKQDILNSKEYKLGCTIEKYLGMLKKLDVKHIISNLDMKRRKNYVGKKLSSHVDNTASIVQNNVDYTTQKIVVYMCVLGKYDNIPVPLCSFDNVDYILITDNLEISNSGWTIVNYNKYTDIQDPILANRYIKFHPFLIFPDYDYSIYIDGNVRPIADIREFINRCSSNTGIAMHRHWERDDIYQEAKACKLLKRGNEEKLEKQIQRYRVEGFPQNFGMNEATIIVSDLHNFTAKKLEDSWWEEFHSSESLRDQIAWPYVLWKNHYSINDVGNLGWNKYNNYKIEISIHK